MRAGYPAVAALFGAAALVVIGSCGKSSDTSSGLEPPNDVLSNFDTNDVNSACPAGKELCGTTCVDLASDKANCGVCGVTCAAAATCCTGKCVETASCSFSITGLGPAGGWENGGDWVTINGEGFAPGMKVFIGDGRAPVRVIDPKTAIIQTPPGPVGPTDVRIDLKGTQAILRGGFAYTEAGLGSPWQQKPMAGVRGEDPGVAVMQDGRVLVAGGTLVPDSTADALDTAEIFTRAKTPTDADKVAPAATKMSTARWQNSAITMLDGRVLVVGGACHSNLTTCKAGSDPKLADVFDPATNAFTPTKTPMSMGRSYTRAILLVDGRVLIVSANAPSVEIFDPTTNTFTTIDHSPNHVFGFMVRLRDGRVLLGAGDGGTTAVEAFDSDTNTFTPVGSLAQGRSKLTAHVLPDGRAFVIGGASVSAGGINVPLDSIEAFDPVTNKWTTMPYKMSIGRCWHASALVRDGTILAMGGYTLTGKCDSLTDSVDQIDPVKGTVTPFAKLPNANCEWTAVTLLDGSVLGVGGGACGTKTALPDMDFLPGKAGPK